MMRSLRFILLAALLPLALVSCNNDDDAVAVDPAHDFTPYFPLTPGHYVTYDVDSTQWDDVGCTRTDTRCQLRYTVADTFTDAQSRRSYRIDIYYRKRDTADWQDHEVVYVTPTADRLEYVQKTLPFIKLIFPIVDGGTWNGNRLINTDDADLTYFRDWIYKYSNVGEAFDTEGKYYDNTITVNAVDYTVGNPEDPAQRDVYASRTYGKEVYASGTGLVFREMTRWIYDPAVAYCRKGYSVTMRAVDNN